MGPLDSTLLYGLGGLCVVLLSVAAVRRWRERGVTMREATRAQSAQLREEERLRAALQDLLAQIDEVAARSEARVADQHARVAAQLARLEDLVRQADARIAQLQALEERSSCRTGALQPVPHPAGQAPAPRTQRRAKPAVEVQPVPPPAPAGTTPAAHASAAAPPQGAAAGDQRRRRTYALADEGMAPIAIADALHLPLGEIELLLNLREYAAQEQGTFDAR